MLVTLLLFLVSTAAIYWSCEYFVNGIEWLGKRMQMGSMAVGAVLAAFGTALPESAVTFIAVVFGRNASQKDLGVGAALGGPLVLATVAYAALGGALLLHWRKREREHRSIKADTRGIGRDQGIFLLVFAVNLILGLVVFPFKPAFGLLLLAVYGVYAWKKIGDRNGIARSSELEPLKIRAANPSLAWAATQAILSLAVIGAASRVFVLQLGAIGTALHWPPQMAALLLSPIATELPETINAIIWVRQGKEQLALANISGAMMIQATVPSALGLIFTPWRFDRSLTISAAVTLAAIAFLWMVFRAGAADARALVSVSGFYCVFSALTLYYFVHRWEHIPATDHARANPVASQPQAIAAGAAGYREHCFQCHGQEARGNASYPALRSARLRRATDGDIEWFLRQGVPGSEMPSWTALQQEERWQIVAYLKSIQ
jgi:cation:H+ antiporter